MELSNISEIWRSLELKSQHETEQDYIKLRIFPESSLNLYLGYDIRNCQKLFMIKIRKENEPVSGIFPQSKGFRIIKLQYPSDSSDSITICLNLLDNQYLDIYTILVRDVLKYILREKSEQNAIRAFLLRLKVWQHFLDKCGNSGLSRAEQIGLYGELRMLSEYLIPQFGTGKAVSSWIGPESGRQDFQFEGKGVEVKTSAGKEHDSIHISSEDQLDNKGLTALYLYHLLIRETRGNLNTLPDLIESICKKIGEDVSVLEKFQKLLIKAGYLDDHKDKYSDVSYSVISEEIYHVEGKFPRIVRENLSQGIGNVSYTLNLSACNEYAISHEEFSSKISG